MGVIGCRNASRASANPRLSSMTFALSLLPFHVSLGRPFLTLDSLGFHAGWAGRWECAWTPVMGWTHGPVPAAPEGAATAA